MISKRLRLISGYLKNTFARRRPDYYLNYSLGRLDRMKKNNLRPGSAILDIGCGYAYPGTAIVSLEGFRVSGVDIASCFWRDGMRRKFIGNMRSLGLLRAIVETPAVWYRERQKFTEIEKHFSAKINHKALDLRTYNGKVLPIADSSFDAAISQDVLEHVNDLRLFWQEITRVLRPGGVIDMTYHNFYCPSGSHMPVIDSDPWAHVRGTGQRIRHDYLNAAWPADIVQSAEKAGIKINQLRPASFGGDVKPVNSFSDAYEGVQWCDKWDRIIMPMIEKDAERLRHLEKSGMTAHDLMHVSRWNIAGVKL
ncbi:MAG TPA: methyltransferase domain-containing protein [Chitinivibrionales bacterium]|nr:methyltransferase domain-containing protein [Chitinivibrionales bacterium]